MDGLWPFLRRMEQGCSGQLLQDPDSLLRNAILEMCIGTGEGKALALRGAILPPGMGPEGSIVSVVVGDSDFILFTMIFESLFATQSFFFRRRLL